jgi:methyl-accepting chemotaxis protein
MVENIKALITDANTLAKAAVEGKLATRADATKHQGDYRKIIEGVNQTLDAVVGHIDSIPVPALIVDPEFGIRYINKTAAGIAGVSQQAAIGTKCYSHFKTSHCNTDKCATGQCMQRGYAVTAETDAHPQGKHLDISYTGVPVQDAERKTIGALEVITDLTAVKAAARMAEKQAGYQAVEVERVVVNLGKLAEGNLDVETAISAADDETRKISENFGKIGGALDRTVKAIRDLAGDTETLVKAAVEGKLATRADATKHRGDYRKIVEGVNQTLDAVIGPLNVAADYVDRISKGDIPPKITNKYNGDFNELKNNLNNCIEATNNQALAARTVAEGDLSVKIEVRSENDVLPKSLIRVVDTLRKLQNELERLTEASKQGLLSERGKPEQFQGAYAEVIRGTNTMLDAILLPIGEGNRVLNLIRGGNLREKVEIECKGDHAKMKDAINGVHLWLSDLIAYVSKIANGDMTATMAKASDADQIHEWLVLMKTNINALVVDTNLLVKAAVDGKLATRADATKHQGDYRKIVEGVNQTLDAVVAPLNEAAAVIERVAAQDLTVQVAGNYQGDHAKIKENINRMIVDLRTNMLLIAQNAQTLASSAEELSAVSQQMSSSATETSTQAGVVSAASEQVSKNVSVVATGSEQMLASIREIARSSNEAAKVARNAVGIADSTNQTVSKLGDSSIEIGNVIKVITSIAQQTNLLALNATIEAARAGEAGKGFAVVANEVKELANQTARATEEIGQRIEAIQSDTKEAVTAIGGISGIINQINDISNSIAASVEEQTATTNEMGRNVNEAAKGTGEIARNITGVATAAQQTNQGASNTENAARSLTEMAAGLQTLVSKFRT